MYNHSHNTSTLSIIFLKKSLGINHIYFLPLETDLIVLLFDEVIKTLNFAPTFTLFTSYFPLL